MCGIVLAVGERAGERARALLEGVRHRGPDGEGLHEEPDRGVALGHQRLAIVDLEGGAQPLASEDGQIVLVANGQIYDDRVWRERLEAAGHRFRTGSDCEVLVHLYEEHGAGMLERVEGMFACILWDRRQRRILVARDRLGQKPLVLARTSTGLLACSEVAPLLADRAVARTLDPAALAAYLAWGYVPAPLTILRDVHKLPPGHLAWIDEEGRVEGPIRYWEPPRQVEGRPGLAELATEVEELLGASVERRLRADAPLGIFLSGGIDSALVAAAAVARGARPPCFCLGFSDSGFEAGWDERSRARATARHLGLELTEWEVGPSVVERLPELAAGLDEPYADSSALLLDELVRQARAHVKVALSGEGGDELFAGYARHRGVVTAARYDLLPRALRHRLARHLAPRLGPGHGKSSRWDHLQRFLASGHLPPHQRYLAWQTILSPDLRARVAPGLAPAAPEALALERMQEGPPGDLLAQALRLDLVHYLPGDLLFKADRIGLGRALEIRTPFLDTRLVERAAGLPGDVRWSGGPSKPVLRHLARARLPESVAVGPKGGFSLPLGRWLAGGQLPALEALLSPGSLSRHAPFLAADAVHSLLKAHRQGQASHTHRLYALAALVAWVERHRVSL